MARTAIRMRGSLEEEWCSENIDIVVARWWRGRRLGEAEAIGMRSRRHGVENVWLKIFDKRVGTNPK